MRSSADGFSGDGMPRARAMMVNVDRRSDDSPAT